MAGSVEEANDWLKLAEQSLLAAKSMREAGFNREAVSRSYYAMFYAAKAALSLADIHAHKHSAVISAFGRHVANVGLVPQRLHRVLIAAFKDRGGADYELGWEPTTDKVQRRLLDADEFVSEIGRYLRSCQKHRSSS